MSGIAGYFQTEFDVERNHTLYAIYESKLTNMQDSLITNCHENSIIYMKHHIGFTASNFSVTHRDSISVTYKNRTASIVFTGNIYNSNELKYKLSSYDISAYELCNEELILYLYLVFGEDIFRNKWWFFICNLRKQLINNSKRPYWYKTIILSLHK